MQYLVRVELIKLQKSVNIFYGYRRSKKITEDSAQTRVTHRLLDYDVFVKLFGLPAYLRNAHFLFTYKLNYYNVFCPDEEELCSKASQELAINFH